jgi:Na+/melibiose symporter-like transporter
MGNAPVEDSSFQQKALYSVGQVGVGVYNGFNNAILNLYLSAFTGNPFLLGYLGNTRTMEGVIIQPLVGRWSDRTASPLGRRRPFILVGIPISVFFLMLIPIFGRAHTHLALPLIAAAIILFSITWNTAADPYQALMVDITAPSKRSIFNAILSVISLAGQVVIVVFASVAALKKNNIPVIVFYVCGVFLLAGFAAVFFGVREPRRAQEQARVEESIPPSMYVREMRTFREAFKLLLSVFFLWSGLNAILPFLTIFPKKIVHATTSEALLVYVALILAAAICAYPFGKLAERYGNRPMIVLGTVLLILAALWGLVVPSYPWLFPLAVLAGCGFSATTALTYPYLSRLVPGSRIGVFTGLQSAFSAVALPGSVLLTGLLIDHFGYRSIFAMLAGSMVFDVLLLLSIDEDAARRQVETVVREEEGIAAASSAPSTV